MHRLCKLRPAHTLTLTITLRPSAPYDSVVTGSSLGPPQSFPLCPAVYDLALDALVWSGARRSA